MRIEAIVFYHLVQPYMPYMFCILHITIVSFLMVSSCLRRISLCSYALLFHYLLLLIRLARLTRVFYTRVRPRCFRLGTFGLSLFCFCMDYSASSFCYSFLCSPFWFATLICIFFWLVFVLWSSYHLCDVSFCILYDVSVYVCIYGIICCSVMCFTFELLYFVLIDPIATYGFVLSIYWICRSTWIRKKIKALSTYSIDI